MTVERSDVAGVNRFETDELYRDIVVERSYLPHPLRLPPAAVVFDVGANIGMFSLFALAESPGATVYAFEPIEPVAAVLRSNLAAHGGAHVLEHGLSDRDRTVEFVYYPGYTTMSAEAGLADTAADRALVRASAEALLSGEDAEVLDEMLALRFRVRLCRARLRRLSDVVDELGIDRIDLLKIDVQRAEEAVVHGVEDRHWPRVRQLVAEVHDGAGAATEGRAAAMSDHLRARGFIVERTQDRRLANTDRHTLIAHRSEAGQGR